MINNPDISSNGVEKRKCRRFHIPGASGKVKEKGFLAILKGVSKPYPVQDISKGGASFLCPDSLKENKKIIFQLIVPHEPALNLHAILKRIGRPNTKGDRMCCVRFMPTKW